MKIEIHYGAALLYVDTNNYPIVYDNCCAWDCITAFHYYQDNIAGYDGEYLIVKCEIINKTCFEIILPD